jgi:hypothetical protein
VFSSHLIDLQVPVPVPGRYQSGSLPSGPPPVWLIVTNYWAVFIITLILFFAQRFLWAFTVHSIVIIIVSGTPTVAMASGFDWYRVISLNKCLSFKFCYHLTLPTLPNLHSSSPHSKLALVARLALPYDPGVCGSPCVCVGFLCVQISGLGSLLVVVVKVCDEGADKPRMVDRLCLACLQLL